jgi:hypothetical protein
LAVAVVDLSTTKLAVLAVLAVVDITMSALEALEHPGKVLQGQVALQQPPVIPAAAAAALAL